MFADIGLADMTLEGGVSERGHVVERIGVDLIHWPNIVSQIIFFIFIIVFKRKTPSKD